MYFTFEFDCENAPMTLTIYVEYTMWSWPGTYDEPAELEINDSKYTVMCGRLDLTEYIKSCTDEKLITEIEDAVNTAIWNDYNNK
jgi:hypothetical protein